MKVKLLKSGSIFNRQAYTLVEVLAGSAILAILMLAVFAGLAWGYSIINTFRQDMRATQILAQKTEFVRLCTWSQLNGMPSKFTDYYYALGSTNNISSTNVAYVGNITVGSATNIPGNPSYSDKIKLVTVTVTWTNKLGSQSIVHQRQMQTQVAYYGLVNYIYGTSFTQQ